MAGALNTSDNMITEREMNNSCDASLHVFDSEKSDPFGSESHGTARYVGNVSNAAGDSSGTNQMVGVVGTLGNKFDFQTMKAANNQKSTRSELPRSELIKMLVYLEGELQARDVVIAALRNERVKHLITQLRSNPIQHNDPLAAMFRDKIALGGNLISRQSSTAAVQAEMEVRVIIEQQMESLYQMVHKQRATHVRMVSILTDSLDNNQRMLQELEEEKRKHEHDTAQGDDITYGLEMERTKLRQELEAERTQTKKLEKDVKKLQETLEFERGRQKQIVLLLIAERKKILMKYIEEGKRSEDLAQILSEEKQRSDSIAEGLEEESKKSLRMEAEMEKQTITFENERKHLRLTLAKEEKRIKELEAELTQLKNENETLKKANILPIRIQAIQNVPAPIIPAKSRPLGDESCGTPSSLVNIAKIVQPTATVSSVPVSGPTTGIARSISPGQNLRATAANIVSSDQSLSSSHGNPPAKGTACSVLGVSPTLGHRALPASSSSLQQQQQQPQQQQPLSVTSSLIASSASPASSSSSASSIGSSSAGVSSSSLTASTSASNIPGASVQLQLNPSLVGVSVGSALSSVVTASNSNVVPSANISNIIASVTVTPIPIAPSSITTTTTTTAAAAIVGTRGIPPPIPPNKPVVPPKREPSISRIGSLAANNK